MQPSGVYSVEMKAIKYTSSADLAMRRICLIVLVIFHQTAAMSQVAGGAMLHVCDAVTKQGIPYTTIRSADFKMGTYADSAGFFPLNSSFKDSLYLSSIGYAAKKIAVADILNRTVFLDPRVDSLAGITVKPWKKSAEQTLGILSARKGITWTSGGHGEEFVQLISFADTSKVYKIKKIFIGAERVDETIPMIIRIYNLDKDGLPYRDILTKKILVKKAHFEKKTRRIQIDLSEENILVKDSACFVGIEWLPVPEQGQPLPSTAIHMTAEITEQLTYTRGFLYSRSQWARPYVTRGQKNPNNTIIAVLVDILE
jgi:hypothetical protein